MSLERDAGVVDRGFLDGRGHHRMEAAGDAAIGRRVDGREHVAGVGRVGTAGQSLRGRAWPAAPARSRRDAGPAAHPRASRRASDSSPSSAARAASSSGSPAKMSSQGQSASAAASARSGPMPDGSPVVTTMRFALRDSGSRRRPRRGVVAATTRSPRRPCFHAMPSAPAAGAARRSGRACACPGAERYASRTGCGMAR